MLLLQYKATDVSLIEVMESLICTYLVRTTMLRRSAFQSNLPICMHLIDKIMI